MFLLTFFAWRTALEGYSVDTDREILLEAYDLINSMHAHFNLTN